MSKLKAPTLAERVAKLEEATGLRTTTAPPPERPECLLYGEPATRALARIFDEKDACIGALRQKLDKEVHDRHLEVALRKSVEASKDRLQRRIDHLELTAEMAHTKSASGYDIPPFSASFFVGGLSGAVLGGIGALIACGGFL